MRGWVENKTYYKKEDESQRLKMGGSSWTINFAEIKDKEIEFIVYITPKAEYKISYGDAVNKGFIRNFQSENKLVVPVRYWKQTLKGVEIPVRNQNER
jgi:hypothetical protein